MSSFVLSSRSISLLAQLIEGENSATMMEALFMESEVDAWVADVAANKLARSLALLNALRTDASEKAVAGALELARIMMVRGKPDRDSHFVSEPAKLWTTLRDALASDGWEFDEAGDRLLPTVPAERVAELVSWLDEELKQRGWSTAAGHYQQAVEAYAAGRWASANSQLRSFFEEFIPLCAGHSTYGGRGQVGEAFDALASAGQLVKGEDRLGKDLWKLLHSNGSHPGLSGQDESRFRLLTLTGYARYLLVRV